MNILVLGGQVFIGRVVVERLLAEGHRVSVLNRGNGPTPLGAGALKADRTKADEVAAVVKDNYDAVVDISGTEEAMVSETLKAPMVAQPPRYIYISSTAVYDRTFSQFPFDEDAWVKGDPVWENYGVAKAACEDYLRAHYRGKLFVLRPPYVYGPYNSEDRESWVWARVLSGRKVPLPGDGTRRLQFCYVQDLARVVSQTLSGSSNPGVYNVAGAEVTTFVEYVETLARVAGQKVETIEVHRGGVKARDYFPFRDVDLYVSIGKLVRDYNFTPTPFEDGMTETLKWFKTDKPEALAYRPSVIEKELGLG